MFSLNDLLVMRAALVVQRKSVERLAAKEGQPETVAAEYRKVGNDIIAVQNRVDAEVRRLQEAEAAKLKK